VRIARQLVYESSDRIMDASALGSAAEGGLAVLLYRNAELFVLRLDSSGAVKQTVSLAAANLHATRDPRGELTDKAATGEVLLPESSASSPGPRRRTPLRAKKTEWRTASVLTSPCDSSNWKLEARGDDWSSPDLLQIVPDSSARAGSAGIIQRVSRTHSQYQWRTDPGSALIVARNLHTGNYEVYKITLVCGN